MAVELFRGASITKKRNKFGTYSHERVNSPGVETGETGHTRTHSSSSMLMGAIAVPTVPVGDALDVQSAVESLPDRTTTHLANV
jgi:hypothetical protein